MQSDKFQAALMRNIMVFNPFLSNLPEKKGKILNQLI